MDMVEYELVASIEAGGTPFMFPDEYLMARLLQLRARGLVRFVTPEDGDYLPGSLELTEAGRAWLARRRPLLSQAAPGIAPLTRTSLTGPNAGGPGSPPGGNSGLAASPSIPRYSPIHGIRSRPPSNRTRPTSGCGPRTG